jgi:hypothetical protein
MSASVRRIHFALPSGRASSAESPTAIACTFPDQPGGVAVPATTWSLSVRPASAARRAARAAVPSLERSSTSTTWKDRWSCARSAGSVSPRTSASSRAGTMAATSGAPPPAGASARADGPMEWCRECDRGQALLPSRAIRTQDPSAPKARMESTVDMAADSITLAVPDHDPIRRRAPLSGGGLPAEEGVCRKLSKTCKTAGRSWTLHIFRDRGAEAPHRQPPLAGDRAAGRSGVPDRRSG